jgi:hypothetical protein
VLVQDSFIWFKAFLAKQQKSSPQEPGKPLSAKELDESRVWVESVFMPGQVHINRLIIENAYLVREVL